MSYKITEAEEGIKVMVYDYYNEIKGGSCNGRDAWVFYDPWGGSIVEMNSAIANGFDHSVCFGSIFVKGLWNKTETFEVIEKYIGGKLCEDAKRALLGANIRGVGVVIYFHKKNFESEMLNALALINNHKFEIEQAIRIEKLPQKEWEKIQNILNKYAK
jgi:hypothetical protein